MAKANRLVRYADAEFRSDEHDSGLIHGIAAVFNRQTDMGWFTEEIDAHALDEADLSDVVLNFNHNDDILLAGTRNGSLQLEIADSGLIQTSRIVSTTQGEDVKKLIREGLITKMSFAFSIAAGGDEWTREGDREHRIIRKIGRVFDVSLVTFPAYSQTSVWRSEGNSDELAEKHRRDVEKREEQNRRMAELLNRRKDG